MRPSRATSRILRRHLAWKSESPTASTSSTTRISLSRWAATAKARRMYMPVEYRLTWVSRNFSVPAKSTMASNRSLISRRRMPSRVPLR